MQKNNYYKDFSNRTSFNGRPCEKGYVLVPVVFNDEMKDYLITLGLDYNNLETWRFPHASRPVIVAFVPCEEDRKEQAMKFFNAEVSDYLKYKGYYDPGYSIDEHLECLSLDKFIEDRLDEDIEMWDVTETTAFEDAHKLAEMLRMLIEDVSRIDEKMGQIITLLSEGFKKKEIMNMVDIGKGKSQAYEFISRAQAVAKEIYERDYRG